MKKKGKTVEEKLVESLRNRIEGLSVRELLEHGFYLVVGLLTFTALGEVRTQEYTRPGTHEYNLAGFRDMLGKLFAAITALYEIVIPGTEARPLEMLVKPAQWLRDVIGVQEDREIDGAIVRVWTKVPMMWRVMMTVAIPSVLYLGRRFLEETIELSGFL